MSQPLANRALVILAIFVLTGGALLVSNSSLPLRAQEDSEQAPQQ